MFWGKTNMRKELQLCTTNPHWLKFLISREYVSKVQYKSYPCKNTPTYLATLEHGILGVQSSIEEYSYIYCMYLMYNQLAALEHTLCTYLIVAAGPEEGRVHECSDETAGSWREASLWRGKCAATFRHPQWVASLSGVIAEQRRSREIKPCWQYAREEESKFHWLRTIFNPSCTTPVIAHRLELTSLRFCCRVAVCDRSLQFEHHTPCMCPALLACHTVHDHIKKIDLHGPP